MPLKKEPCRNFMRGSCHYGDRCKFLHTTQQQPKPNAFGFGSQTASPFQQQKPNPFGFGVQNSGATSGARQKPFENKWVRPEQPKNQSQAANHICTDPDSCKRLIAEDIQQERPLWKLTCYAHYRCLPCDITGDISYEELRAVAYDDAKRGTNLQAIVERERSLVKSKEIEFENLRQNPYTKHAFPAQSSQGPFPAQSSQSPFPAVTASSPSLTPQNSSSSPFPTSSQQSPSPNLSFGVRPSTPSTSGFGQFQVPGASGSNGFTAGSFGTQAPAQTGGNPFATNSSGFGKGGPGGTSSQGTQFPAQGGGNSFVPSMLGFGAFGASNQGPQVPVQTGPFASSVGGFGNGGGMSIQGQVPVQNNPFAPKSGGFGNSGSVSTQNNQTPSTTLSLQSQNSAVTVSNSSTVFNGLGDAKGGQQMIDNDPQGDSAVDVSIWLKSEWKCGEIPEQPPPAEYCR